MKLRITHNPAFAENARTIAGDSRTLGKVLQDFREFAQKKSLLLPILALQLLQVVLVPPLADMPSNDDWMYASMVNSVILDHVYQHHPYVQPTSIAHVLWGALFCSVLGMNFMALKCSTLVMAIAGAWAVARCALACGHSRRAALLGGMLVTANPLYLHLSNTFMTDVSYFALLALSSWGYLQALREKHTARWILIGGGFGVLAFFVRQFGLFAAAAYFVSTVYIHLRARPRPSPAECLAFIVPWLFAGVGYLLWKNTVWPLFGWSPLVSTDPIPTRILGLAAYATVIVTLIAIYLAPVILAFITQPASRRTQWTRASWLTATGFVALAVYTFCFFLREPMPKPGNVFHAEGVGPITIGGQPFDIPPQAQPIFWFWVVATCFFVAAAGILIGELLARTKSKPTMRPAQTIFLVVLAGLVFASSYSPYVWFPFDRYTVPLLLPATLLATQPLIRLRHRRAIRIAAIATMVVFSFSVAALQDYTGWASARWMAVNYLLHDKKIDPRHIDGGFEFNGIYTSREFLRLHPVQEFWQSLSGGWWVLDDEYRIAFTQVAGYEVIRRFPYYSWLGFRERDVLVLKRTGGTHKQSRTQ